MLIIYACESQTCKFLVTRLPYFLMLNCSHCLFHVIFLQDDKRLHDYNVDEIVEQAIRDAVQQVIGHILSSFGAKWFNTRLACSNLNCSKYC